MKPYLLFTVEISDTEDQETVEAYYEALTTTFKQIVNLSAYAFDTPDVKATLFYDEYNHITL